MSPIELSWTAKKPISNMKEISSENNPQYDALILCSWSRVWKEAWTEWLSVLQVVILIFFAILKLTWTTLRLKSHTCSYWYVSHTGLPGGASFFWLESSLAKMGGVGKETERGKPLEVNSIFTEIRCIHVPWLRWKSNEQIEPHSLCN